MIPMVVVQPKVDPGFGLELGRGQTTAMALSTWQHARRGRRQRARSAMVEKSASLHSPDSSSVRT